MGDNHEMDGRHPRECKCEIDRRFYDLAKTRMLANITQEFDFGIDEGSVEFSGAEEEFAK